jgi:predicted hotdog family 3-hydroxylacyl-ACP dehydratase
MTPDELNAALQPLVGSPAKRYVLHRKSMLFLDTLTAIGPESAECEWSVREDFPLVVPGLGVPSYTGIEYMAQCVAVLSGARARVQGLEPPLGLLLGTRSYECTIPYFEVGEHYESQCEEVVRDSQGMGSFACRLVGNGDIIARANLAVFETPEKSIPNE